VSVELEQDVADQNAGGCRRAAGGHADDEQAILPRECGSLWFGQRDRLARDSKVPALEPAVLDHGGRRLPRDRRGDHDAQAAD
jgi:hypothetical protein